MLNLLYLQISIDVKFLQIGWFCCDQFSVKKKYIRIVIGVLTKNLLHKNPEWNLTADHRECSRC